jgi:hypothetical protein
MGVGTFLGNILAVVLIMIPGMLGFISLEASTIAFIVISYGVWLLVILMNFSAGRTISQALQMCLDEAELRAFRRYNVHVRASGAGEVFSALLNGLRLAGFVWAGLCAWQSHYVLAALSAAFFFVSAGAIVRTNPLLYMEPKARSGNDVVLAELGALQSLKVKRDRYLADLP